MTDEQRLAEIEVRCDAATKAPWCWGTGPCEGRLMGKIHGSSVILMASDHPAAESEDEAPCLMLRNDYRMVVLSAGHPDAAFIANSREDIPWLIERVRKLQQKVGDLKDEIREL